jgi:hypothetical protein
MKEGIQSSFPDPTIKKYGCYLLALIQSQDPSAEIADAVKYAREFEVKGWMGKECFIQDPDSILRRLGGKFPVTIRKNLKPGFTHFTLRLPEVWDSLDPDRPAAKSYTSYVDYVWDKDGVRSYVTGDQ